MSFACCNELGCWASGMFDTRSIQLLKGKVLSVLTLNLSDYKQVLVTSQLVWSKSRSNMQLTQCDVGTWNLQRRYTENTLFSQAGDFLCPAVKLFKWIFNNICIFIECDILQTDFQEFWTSKMNLNLKDHIRKSIFMCLKTWDRVQNLSPALTWIQEKKIPQCWILLIYHLQLAQSHLALRLLWLNHFLRNSTLIRDLLITTDQSLTFHYFQRY